MATDQNFRSEHDSIGDRALPKDAYYGVQSLRAAENFHITGLTMHPEIINPSRKERIAKGSGTTLAEVNKLLKQFDQTRKVMKSVATMKPGMAKGRRK